MRLARRTVLLAGAAAAWPASAAPSLEQGLVALERTLGGHIGLFVSRGAKSFGYRAKERFAYCSVFKWILSAAILEAAQAGRLSLDDRIVFTEKDLLEPSTLTKPHLGEGMTLAQLCHAAVTVSDNTAADLLEKRVGGLEAMRAFVKKLGDTTTRFDRLEPDLNTNLPGDPRDTTTPEAMARSLEAAYTRDVLDAGSKRQLFEWMQAATTGFERIRGVVPKDWQAGDKTGTSGNGGVNDVAVLRPPTGAPLYLAILTNAAKADTSQSAAAIAAATRLVLGSLDQWAK